ncbi:MAG: hypothetical protein HY883_05445 [Deltaproteobacteria bacterium]|nr:hypothetical protein [Deltaproteobacteria bacterium]
MAGNKKDVRVAIVGLGRVGSTFLGKFAAKEGNGIKIIAASERNANAPGVEPAKKRGIPVHQSSKEIVAMSEAVDIIFDFTGNPDTRRTLRSELARSGNQHTVIAPEMFAILMWNMMGEEGEFPGDHKQKGY